MCPVLEWNLGASPQAEFSAVTCQQLQNQLILRLNEHVGGLGGGGGERRACVWQEGRSDRLITITIIIIIIIIIIIV